MSREVEIKRETLETSIKLYLNLDGTGSYKINTSVPFLDHMLTLFAVHGAFDLTIDAIGDIDIDDHHTVEDIGIVLGTAFNKVLDDKKGIARYGNYAIPMDEALAQVVLDFSNRPYLVFNVDLPTEKIGRFDTELLEEFMRALAVNAGMTLHINVPYGNNSHHIAEAIFKALGHAISQAVNITQPGKVLSSKGTL